MRDDLYDQIEYFTKRGRKLVTGTGVTPVHSTSIAITFTDTLIANNADRTAVFSEDFTVSFSPNKRPNFVEGCTTIHNRDATEARADKSMRKYLDGKSDGIDQRMLDDLQLFVKLLSSLPKWGRKVFARAYFADLAHHFWQAFDDSQSKRLTRSQLDELVSKCVPVDSVYLRAPLIKALDEFHNQQSTEQLS